jgi:4-hydroxybenzoate polyprenyltransferase
MIRLFLREIRIEHTLFALPFAYVGASIGANGGPTWSQLAWVTLAVFGARTAAMAANRVLDRKIDMRNPRTAKRATATGRLPLPMMISAIVAGLLLTLLAATRLDPLCVLLFPIAALGLLLYPLCKRFTWGTHFVLGAIDGLAPLGAAIGVSGHVSTAALLLFFAVTVWVAGFDILYALMDLDVDVDQGISSIPAAFGKRVTFWLPVALHGVMIVLLASVGLLIHARPVYVLGLFAALCLTGYEQYLILKSDNAFALNDKVFRANMIFSLIYLTTTDLSLLMVSAT